MIRQLNVYKLINTVGSEPSIDLNIPLTIPDFNYQHISDNQSADYSYDYTEGHSSASALISDVNAAGSLRLNDDYSKYNSMCIRACH